MKDLPFIRKFDGAWQLIVDEQPFIALGGEIHNSSASDPVYMEKVVWPAVKDLGVNFLLVPAYWEMLEPQEGIFDYSYLDQMIEKARTLGIRLGLLWFGMWKGPDSLFIPLWLKAQLTDEDFQRTEDGRLIRQLSPFAEKVFDADLNAYQNLCRHLKEYDAEEQTVIMLQVENEPGTWFHRRDCSAAAREVFASPVPIEIAEEYGVSGSWAEAFSDNVISDDTANNIPGGGIAHGDGVTGDRKSDVQVNAEDLFMNWIISKRIQTLAESGKKIYALPTFTNCVPSMGFLKVSGGPSADHADFWKKHAPAIDVLTPNVYDPDFEKVTDPYRREDNALMVPENDIGIDCAGRALYAAGRGALMYSPFGIEDCFQRNSEEYKSALLGPAVSPEAGENLRDAYTIIRELYPQILAGLKTGKTYAIFQRPEEKTNIPVPGFGGMVSFQGGDARTIETEKYKITFRFGYSMNEENAENTHKAPKAAALILEKGEDDFLFAGVNGCLEIQAKDENYSVFTDDLREYVIRGGKLAQGRILNGDERNAIAAGTAPTLLSLKLSLHK